MFPQVDKQIMQKCYTKLGGHNRLCKWLGEPVPLTAEAPMLMITERLSPFLGTVVGATSRHRHLVFTSLYLEFLLLGATAVGGGGAGGPDVVAGSRIDVRPSCAISRIRFSVRLGIAV